MTELDKEEKDILHAFENGQLVRSASANEQIALAKQAAKKYINDQKSSQHKNQIKKN